MPRTIIKSRFHSNKHKPKIKQELNNTKSNLPPHLQTFKKIYYQETALLNINSFFYIINELRRFSIFR